jgi:hypothetical protein
VWRGFITVSERAQHALCRAGARRALLMLVLLLLRVLVVAAAKPGRARPMNGWPSNCGLQLLFCC